uniref:Uncharacterized protein n=1 Tax=Lactuca sativa TaxID=4236 RepID=A0A9R1VCY0_LACSA|nr:hypothetical protein LSAT_V11C600330790 [Lactuca sativa]
MEGTKIVTEVGPSCSRSRSPDYHRRNRRGRYDDDYDDERSPSRSPIRSPSRSRSPEGGGNEKASTSSPYSHGRADSRSPLQRSDSNVSFFYLWNH